MPKISSRDRRQLRRDQAKERQAAYEQLSNEQRLQNLIDRGHDHCAEADALKDFLHTHTPRK